MAVSELRIGEKNGPRAHPEAVRFVWLGSNYMPIALCASAIYFMHSALLPAFIAALD
jgi:hypothetical protein